MTERQDSESPPEGGRSQPFLLPTVSDQRVEEQLNVRRREMPQPNATLGDVGLTAEIDGPDLFEETVLVQGFDRTAVAGIDPTTLRAFRWEPEDDRLRPVWRSGA